MEVNVTYVGHSGVLVQTEQYALLFDYYTGTLPIREMEAAKHALVFASHVHGDHYNRQILSLKAQKVLSYDIPDPGILFTRLAPGQTTEMEGAKITAFGSTDAGVSFLVELEGKSIFHAGDLNLWHWKDESTEEEIRQAYADFKRELAPLSGHRLDLAFFPVDPRLGTDYDEGARMFCDALHPSYFMPLHFGGNIPALEQFAQSPSAKGITVLIPRNPGASFPLSI